MPLTPLRRRKLEKIFSVLDMNGDGRVDRSDFLARVDAYARLCGWPDDSPQLARNRAFALEEWANLRESADVEDDGTVTREEFLHYGDVYLSDRDAVRAYARGDVQLMFDAMDTDGDGRISAEEYREYLQVVGVDASAADLYFAHADLDEDGRITRAEMSHAVEEYLVSEDADAPSARLFGPL